MHESSVGPPSADNNTNTGWTSVRVTPPTDDPRERQTCFDTLFGLGAEGVHDHNGVLITHFPPSVDMADVVSAFGNRRLAAHLEFAPVSFINWSEAWKDRITVHHAGNLTIAPPWLSAGLDSAKTIVIDPGMAFGTGDHATTRGVVRLLQDVIRSGDIVADLGAGSAVLAIAAAKLGASRVYAIEIDGDAIDEANRNVSVNGVDDRVHVFEADAAVLLPLVQPVRVVIANIISSVLLELLPLMKSALSNDAGHDAADVSTSKGVAILSGILVEERSAMLDAFSKNGWLVLAEFAEDIWWSVAIALE